MSSIAPPSRGRAYLYLSLTTAIWGSLYVVTRMVLETIPPFTILFFRYIAATAALMVLLRVRRLRGAPRTVFEPKDRKYLLFISGVGYFLSIGCQIVGMKYAGASVASLINAMNPVCIILFATLILGERLTLNKVVAAGAAVSGAGVILGYSSGGEAWGIGFSVLSVILWAFTTVFARRVAQRYDPLALTAWAGLLACGFMLPASLVELSLVPHGELFSAKNLLCLLYLGTLGTTVPNLLWNKSLSVVEASVCSLFYPIQPLTTVLLGVLLLGERVDARFLAGSALIVGGVVYAVLSSRKKG